MAGQLHTSNGQLAYEIELEDQAIADRLINTIQDLYDIKASSHIVGPQGSTKKSRIQLRIGAGAKELTRDRKSTRLNSSHVAISYAVFCLRKKKPRKSMDAA